MRLLIVLDCLVFGVSCLLPYGKDPVIGRKCTADETGSPKIVWYHDTGRKVPYPFKYLGCGEMNGANYENARGYEELGLPTCPGYFHHPDGCFENVRRYIPSPKPIKNCTAGHYCMVYPWFDGEGICCSTDVTKKYEENQKANCPAGSTAVLNKQNGKEILFGKKCSHDFCPTGSKCIEGAIEAFCCQKK